MLYRMTSDPKRVENADFGDLIKVMTADEERKRPTARQVADYLRLGDFAWSWRGGMPDGEGAVVSAWYVWDEGDRLHVGYCEEGRGRYQFRFCFLLCCLRSRLGMIVK